MKTPGSLKFLATLAACLLCVLTMRAQWNDVGTANLNGGSCVQLTNQWLPDQTGAAWHDCQIHLGANFDLTTVNLGNSNAGADGMCFVLHQAGNMGASVGDSEETSDTVTDLGPTSIAVEIDIINDTNNDPSYDHIAINGGGNVNHNLSPAVQANVSSANIEMASPILSE